MKKISVKNLVSIVIALILVLQCSPLLAFANSDGEMYTYTYSNGEVVNYYIDEEGHEYTYKKGAKIYVLLPLEKYRTKEKDLQNEVSTATTESNQNSLNSYNTNDGYVYISTLFKNTVDLPKRTGYMGYPSNADCLRIRTTECKPALVSHRVDVHLYTKTTDGEAYDYHYFDQNCSQAQGYSLVGRVVSQVNVYVASSSAKMTSCLLTVTATEG